MRVCMVAGMGGLGRYQQLEQLLMIVLFVWVVMVVPDEPKAWQRQAYQEEHRETQGTYTLMCARSHSLSSQRTAALSGSSYETGRELRTPTKSRAANRTILAPDAMSK